MKILNWKWGKDKTTTKVVEENKIPKDEKLESNPQQFFENVIETFKTVEIKKASEDEKLEDQFQHFLKSAANEAGIKALIEAKIDEDALQRLIKNGAELQLHIIPAICSAIEELSISHTFEEYDENMKKCWRVYPKNYKPKPITEQIAILRRFFPKLGSANEQLALGKLPRHAEGWFAIPRWEILAPTYNDAVKRVVRQIRNSRDFYGFCGNKLNQKYLRQFPKTARMFKKLGEEQKGYDILIVPAQFGLRHKGRSVRRALKVMNTAEFALGTFASGIMLLTHPERLEKHDLGVYCGDLYYDESKNKFSNTLIFSTSYSRNDSRVFKLILGADSLSLFLPWEGSEHGLTTGFA